MKDKQEQVKSDAIAELTELKRSAALAGEDISIKGWYVDKVLADAQEIIKKYYSSNYGQEYKSKEKRTLNNLIHEDVKLKST